MTIAPFEVIDLPAEGRVHHGVRRVRLGDVDLDGALRLDAIARFFQDAGNDDTDDAGVGTGGIWVTRRVLAEFDGALPHYLDDVDTFTFCGGYGRLVVERRTDVVNTQGVVRTATTWAYLDPVTMRPAPIPEWFHTIYAATARGRVVRAKLSLPPPPPEAVTRSMELRVTDFDVLGHVNNAIAWAVTQDECIRRVGHARVRRIVLEYPSAIEASVAAITVRSVVEGSTLSTWMMVDDEVCVATWVAFA